MRINSLLFVAVLFTCFNISSTSSISTTARSLTSKQEDVAAHGVGIEMTKEERIFNFSGFDKTVEGVNAMASKFMEKMLYWILRASGKNKVEAYKFLRLDKEKSIRLRNVRYNAWLKYLAKNADASTLDKAIEQERLKREEDKSLLKLLAESKTDNSKANVHEKLTSVLINSWRIRNLSARSVFKLLELHVVSTSDHSVDIDRLELWVHYVQEAFYYSTNAMVEAINGFDIDVRVMILGSLRYIKNTEFAEDRIEISLLSSWAESKVSVEKVFATLNLDHVKDELLFNTWIKYVIKVLDTLKPSEEVVTKLSANYGDEGLVTMFLALAVHNVGKDLQVKLKSALMSSWKAHKVSPLNIYNYLSFNEKSQSAPLREKAKKELFVQYVDELLQTQT